MSLIFPDVRSPSMLNQHRLKESTFAKSRDKHSDEISSLSPITTGKMKGEMNAKDVKFNSPSSSINTSSSKNEIICNKYPPLENLRTVSMKMNSSPPKKKISGLNIEELTNSTISEEIDSFDSEIGNYNKYYIKPTTTKPRLFRKRSSILLDIEEEKDISRIKKSQNIQKEHDRDEQSHQAFNIRKVGFFNRKEKDLEEDTFLLKQIQRKQLERTLTKKRSSILSAKRGSIATSHLRYLNNDATILKEIKRHNPNRRGSSVEISKEARIASSAMKGRFFSPDQSRLQRRQVLFASAPSKCRRQTVSVNGMLILQAIKDHCYGDANVMNKHKSAGDLGDSSVGVKNKNIPLNNNIPLYGTSTPLQSTLFAPDHSFHYLEDNSTESVHHRGHSTQNSGDRKWRRELDKNIENTKKIALKHGKELEMDDSFLEKQTMANMMENKMSSNNYLYTNRDSYAVLRMIRKHKGKAGKVQYHNLHMNQKLFGPTIKFNSFKQCSLIYRPTLKGNPIQFTINK